MQKFRYIYDNVLECAASLGVGIYDIFLFFSDLSFYCFKLKGELLKCTFSSIQTQNTKMYRRAKVEVYSYHHYFQCAPDHESLTETTRTQSRFDRFLNKIFPNSIPYFFGIAVSSKLFSSWDPNQKTFGSWNPYRR